MVGLAGGRSPELEKLLKVAVTRRIWRTNNYSSTGGGSWLIATHEVITDIPVRPPKGGLRLASDNPKWRQCQGYKTLKMWEKNPKNLRLGRVDVEDSDLAMWSDLDVQ